jgi:phospholipid/cholesterol/gamma-HCH transport system permease protein
MTSPRDEPVRLSRGSPDSWTLKLAGAWTGKTRPDLAGVVSELAAAPGLQKLAFESGSLGEWDSFLLISVERLRKACLERGIELDIAGLPEGAQGLLQLAWAVPERAGARRSARRASFFEQLGEGTLAKAGNLSAAVRFAGELVCGLGRMLTRRARYRRSDIFLFMQESGAEALAIVTLISLLVGTILAFVGSIQLTMFGAEIYVADLVAVGMAVEMGALMTAIIMSGRTGASFAAQLGTMQVNEEIDALQTMGLSPFDFLVLPRAVALMFMMPLLCVYADLVGIIGGAIVGIGMLGIEPVQYYTETAKAVGLNIFAQGIIKAAVFGVVIAFCGCLQGMRCGRSAQAVGEATTKAVVQCITWIVVVDAVMTLIFLQTGF